MYSSMNCEYIFLNSGCLSNLFYNAKNLFIAPYFELPNDWRFLLTGMVTIKRPDGTLFIVSVKKRSQYNFVCSEDWNWSTFQMFYIWDSRLKYVFDSIWFVSNSWPDTIQPNLEFWMINLLFGIDIWASSNICQKTETPINKSTFEERLNESSASSILLEIFKVFLSNEIYGKLSVTSFKMKHEKLKLWLFNFNFTYTVVENSTLDCF